MLGKLLKYDLKWIYKVVGIFYILAIVFSVIGRALAEIENSLLFDVLSKISCGVAVAMIVNSLINCMMRLWARFVKNIYKDESYLTHTLPVDKKTIYNSKIITALITIVTTVIVILICLFICYYSKENLEVLKKLLEMAATTYDTTVVKFLLLISVVILLEIIYMVLIGYVGVILGHKTNKNKMLMSIIIGFAIYMIMQVFTLVLMLIYGIFDPNIMNLINTTEAVNIDAIKLVMYLAVVIYAAYIVFIYYLGKIKLQKGVNVD